MSANFLIYYLDKRYPFEIDSNLELKIEGYDLNYEILAASLGEDPADVIIVLRKFNVNPVRFVVLNWVPSPGPFASQEDISSVLMWAACGWVEHILPVFKKEFPEDLRLQYGIEVVRNYVLGLLEDVNLLEEASKETENADRMAWNQGKKYAELVSTATAGVIQFAIDHSIGNESRYTLSNILPIAMTSIISDEKAKLRATKEAEWQLRFLIRTMERWQDKLPLPEIGDVP